MTAQQGRELATLGGGCFWCLEPIFKDLKGVESVVSGYADGTVPNPSYEQVCGGRTSHAEVVQIAYDPNVISYRDLLDVFFTVHDPTTKDRQGADDVLLEVGLQVEKPVGYAEDFPNATVWSGSNALSPG